MKRLSLLILIIVSSVKTFSQDSAWTKKIIDENLTVSFPLSAIKMDTLIKKNGKEMRLIAYSMQSGYFTLAIIVTPGETNLDVNSDESLQVALAGIAKGASETMAEKGWECSASD